MVSTFAVAEYPIPRIDAAMIELLPEAPSAEVQAQVLLSLIPAFLDSCRAAGVAETTLQNYKDFLDPFRAWWQDKGPECGYVLTPAVLNGYAVYVTQSRNRSGHPLRRGTVDTCVRRARQFLKWLYKTGRLPLDISQWIPKPPAPKPRSRTLLPAEIATLLHACAGGYRLRNMALIAFLVETGVRRHEAAAATWCNVRYVGQWCGWVHLDVTKRYLASDKQRDVVFGDVTGKLLRLLQVLQAENDDPRIFRISNAGIAKMLAKLSEKTGIEFGAHDMRRTWATHWIKHCRAPNRDYAERLLEFQLGHAPRTVTQKHYLALTIQDVLDNWVTPFDEVTLPGLTGP